MYIVYILHNSAIDKYYVGHTSNLANRLKDHNKITHKVKYAAKQKGEWKLQYQEAFETKKLAVIREQEIKRWKSRKMIAKLIEQSRL